jgi:hypothetical protein
MDLSRIEKEAGSFHVQSSPYEIQKKGPPQGLNADICGITAQRINQITLQGSEHTEFGTELGTFRDCEISKFPDFEQKWFSAHKYGADVEG